MLNTRAAASSDCIPSIIRVGFCYFFDLWLLFRFSTADLRKRLLPGYVWHQDVNVFCKSKSVNAFIQSAAKARGLSQDN